MRVVADIYRAYRIMPSLALHQLRVAAVAKLICVNLSEAVDTESVVTACLFHDMGNIIKSELPYFPQFLQPEGLPYWESVKSDFIAKYGNDEHHASLDIARELALAQAVVQIIDVMEFSKMDDIDRGNSTEAKIAAYSDMRVGPYGVLSMSERMREGQARYEKRPDKAGLFGAAKYQVLCDALRHVEQDIFSQCRIRPEDISDDPIRNLLPELAQRQL